MLLEKVKELNIPKGEYAVLGSGPIAVRGLRDSKDIDLIVTEKIFDQYKEKQEWKLKEKYDNKYLEKESIELWNKIGPGKWDIRKLIDRAETIKGLPFVNMKDFMEWKSSAGRKKDARDLKTAKKYLQNPGKAGRKHL